MQKGISPLVATVLLIAITMTLAGIVAFWGASFVRTGLPTENQTQTLQACTACTSEDLQLFSYYYNSTSGNLDITLQNKCSYTLILHQVVFKYSNGVTEIKDVNENVPPGLSRKTVTNVPQGFVNFMITTTCKNILLNISTGE
jgi:flagellin-like protein